MSQNLSKHERRKIKLQQKKEESIILEEEVESAKKREKLKKYAMYAVGVLIIGFIILNAINSSKASSYPGFTPGNIHWHAIPTVTICGQQREIPRPVAGHHLGSSLLHTHEDGRIHVEGYVSDPSQITIQAFFSNVGVTLTENQVFKKKNGDLCPNGKAGKVNAYINKKKTDNFLNYSVRDNDVVEIKFE